MRRNNLFASKAFAKSRMKENIAVKVPKSEKSQEKKLVIFFYCIKISLERYRIVRPA